jgi:tetratricopeptide (TPR) repeat protein
MNKDQAVFFLGGILFGLVVGYVAAYQIHKASTAPAAVAASTGPTHTGSTEGGGAPAGAAGGPQGEALMQQVMESIATLRSRLEANPRDQEALVGLGNLYSDAGKFDQAIEYYNRAIEIDPRNPDMLSDLGVSYRGAGDPQRAIATFRRALEARPDHWQSWLNISIVAMFDLRDLAQAEEALGRLESLKPDFPNLKALRDHLEHLRREPASGSPSSAS